MQRGPPICIYKAASTFQQLVSLFLLLGYEVIIEHVCIWKEKSM